MPLNRQAFTLSELLITLTIIGVILALVLPPVVQNSQDAQFKAGKDKVRMSIAEAGRLLSVAGSITEASSAEDFVKNHLSKQLKIVNFCAPVNMEQCGIPSGNPTKFKDLYDTNVASMPTTWADMTVPYVVSDAGVITTTSDTVNNFNNSYSFLTGDGIAVNLFYNPYCVANKSEKTTDYQAPAAGWNTQLSLDAACMSGVYDMNGLAKPNQVGRDIGFFGVFYNGLSSTATAALPYDKEGIDTESMTWSDANTYCESIKGWKLPTVDELSALYLGRNITGLTTKVWRWTASSVLGSSYSLSVGFGSGSRRLADQSTPSAVRCVRD